MKCINAKGLRRKSGQRGTQPSLPVKEAALYSYRSASMGSIRMARVAGG
jgi:hypothetical protein